MQDEPNPRWLNCLLLALAVLVLLAIAFMWWLSSLPDDYF
jgi:hypothetical protein